MIMSKLAELREKNSKIVTGYSTKMRTPQIMKLLN